MSDNFLAKFDDIFLYVKGKMMEKKTERREGESQLVVMTKAQWW